ncbi:MAG: TonB-dependent receptor [Bacteroidota bacterium]
MLQHLLGGLLLMQTFLLIAQNADNLTIDGTVVDSSGDPVVYAYVKLDSFRTGTTTDLSGNFTFNAVPSGHHQISVRMFGFKTATKRVEVVTGSIITIHFSLEQEIQSLETVVINVESAKERKENSAEAVDVIETKEVKLQSADLGEVMAKTEGIGMQRAGGLRFNTRFALNGLSDDQIRFFFDEIPLNFTPCAFGIANVSINAINRIGMYKGVVPIQFDADALGGAVNLVSPTIFYEGIAGSISYQYGSFNTHRVANHLSYASDNSWLSIATGGFFDYTDNNYEIDVAIPNNLEALQPQTVEQLHDGYRAYGGYLKAGIRQKSWVNVLSLEGHFGNYIDEVQNSQALGLIDLLQLGLNKVVGGNPFGEVLFTSQSKGLNIHYQIHLCDSKSEKLEAKRDEQRWVIDLKARVNFTERVSIDNSRNLCNWGGEIECRQIQAGEFDDEDRMITTSWNYFVRQQLTYSFSKVHQLKLAISPTYTYRTGDDLLVDGEFDPALDDGYLFDFVTGIEFIGTYFKENLQTILFAKNYWQSIRIESLDPSLEEMTVEQRSVSNNGIGGGLRYAWSPHLTTKFNYEFAYCLPRQDEIFGDGQLLLESLELRQENSHNVNLQWNYGNRINENTNWQVSSNFFLRRIDDLILLLVGANELGSYQNIWSAHSQGIELGAEVRNLIKGLKILANSTYQSYYNTSNEGPFAGFKGERIPNTPYFFANGGVLYEPEELIKDRDRLSLFRNTRYMWSFFVSWESAGLQQFKAQVSDQTTHADGATYSIKTLGIQYAHSIEMQNLTHTNVFDLYGVQRPG